jgi:hypothetical protein
MADPALVGGDPLRMLGALGAAARPHANGSLAQHLRGTEALLRQWGNREALCIAGLYHAVYGTDGYDDALASLAMRATIAGVIGADAEGIAYRYGACARDVFHPRIGTVAPLRFADRFGGCEYPISEAELRDFCELTLANEADLALGSARYRVKHRATLADLFERMRGSASEAALAAALRALGTAAED